LHLSSPHDEKRLESSSVALMSLASSSLVGGRVGFVSLMDKLMACNRGPRREEKRNWL